MNVIIYMSDSNNDENSKIFLSVREDILNKINSNSEAYDKTIISLSSAFLLISTSFLTKVIDLDIAIYSSVLKISWILFFLSICSVILSFIVSNNAQEIELANWDKYKETSDEQFLYAENKNKIWLDFFNISSGIFFISAVGLTLIFMIENLGGF